VARECAGVGEHRAPGGSAGGGGRDRAGGG
jgi:hypothetical protein